MKVIEKNYRPQADCEAFFRRFPGRSLFFDIETTGLSSRYHQVYLIGATWYEDQDWHFIQWFADTAFEEAAVLKAFSAFLMGFDRIVHFNGDTFDIPFLKGRFSHYSLSDPFPLFESTDLLKLCRPVKKLLSLENVKLKTIERFLGIDREDVFTGGELIEVYHRFLNRPTDADEHDLMLHNEEDVMGMPELLPILTYLDLASLPWHYEGQSTIDLSRSKEGDAPALCLRYSGPCHLPRPFISSTELFRIDGRRNTLSLFLLPRQDTLAHYLPNPKDYYYLTLEKRIVPKSIGSSVDPAYRTKVSPDECCVRKEGFFYPQPGSIILPEFKTTRKDRNYYFSWQEGVEITPTQAEALLHGFLKTF